MDERRLTESQAAALRGLQDQGIDIEGWLATLQSAPLAPPAVSTRICLRCGETHDVPVSELQPGGAFICDHCHVAELEQIGVVS
jgi:hypothetical protein